MRRILLPLLLVLGVFLGIGMTAHAASLSVPGLENDSRAYLATLTKRSPAGLPSAARRTLEQRAADAIRRNDMPAAADALESRIGGGEPTLDLWMALARAQLRRTPPEPARAAQAAWQAYDMTQADASAIPPLLLLADAFRAMKRYDYAIRALENVQELEPDNAEYAKQLADLQRLAGIQVRRVTTEPEADPPSVCIDFTTAPVRRADFVPGDWVRLDPPQPNAAITREGDQICIAGLRLGTTTRVTLRAGMPGEGGINLIADNVLNVAMANRAPRLVFDTRLFLLPRSQTPAVTLSSINLSKVKLALYRISERNVAPTWRYSSMGSADGTEPSGLADTGKLVWEGTADIPHWQPNQIVRTKLPLPDAFADAGAYVLQVTPGDGSPYSGASASQVLVRTDLAPTVWRGSDGLTVQVRGFGDTAVKPGVHLRLIAGNNDVLAETTTDAGGIARFPKPLLQGDGSQAPQMIHGMQGTDFVALDLTTAAFDLSDRGVEGMQHPGPLDAFAWTDRGIYRPGETVQLMALLRDAGGAPADVPAHVVIKRPNGQVFLDRVPPRAADASVHLPFTLSLSAPAGQWTVEILADPKKPAIGSATFRVDAFVPDRMAVELTTAGPIVPGKPYNLPLTARFLYGAPASNLTGSGTLILEADPNPPAALAGYRIGLDGEILTPDTEELTVPTTDAEGKATLPILLKAAPDTTRPMRAKINVGVDDPSGRASYANASIPVRPASNLLGIKPLFDGAVDANSEAAFEVAAVNPDGARIAIPARIKLVRERPDWRLVRNGTLARYETVYRDEPIESADIRLTVDAPFRFTKRLDFGRYRLEVAEQGGLAATSVRFRAGWVASDSPDVPDKADVSTDRKSYRPGDVARIHVAAPFPGRATLLALTDRVQSLRDVEIPAGGTDLELPVDAAWGPGAYATVHVFRGDGAGKDRPARAIGLVWVGIDPETRTLPLTIAAPAKAAPRGPVTIPIRTAPGAWITLAAVDEGILRLTKFVSPDPGAHFLGRRTLGLDIRDDWGRLIPPADGEATALRQGGDDGAFALPEIPQKVVALFTPPVQAGADGVAQIPLDLPDFNGQVRLMAVAWMGTKVGAAHVDMIVRDPLVAEPLLPRFLAPGDEARFAVLLQNLDLPSGEAVAQVSVEGPLAIDGETRLAATLDVGARALRTTTLRATGVGRGIIRLAVSGPGGFQIQRETAILVRPARPAVNVVASNELAPRTESRLEPALSRMIGGTGAASVRFGGPVRYDPAALLRQLQDYPLSCLEQVGSKGLPLTVAPPGGSGEQDRAAELQADVALVLDRQRYDGGFGLWSANGDAETWLSAYATEFLLRARKAGVALPEAGLRDALKFIAARIEENADNPDALVVRAYDLYVLALAGQPRAGANRVRAEEIDTLPTPLAKAQLAAALALSNDRPRAEAAFRAALDDMSRKDWYTDRGSALRDRMAITTLLKESGLLPDRLTALIATLPGADLKPDLLNTQEAAWAATAAAVLGRDSRPIRVSVNGQDRGPAPVLTVALSGPASARNLDDRPVWQTVSTRGVPIEPAPAARSQMRVTRKFFTLSGEPLNLDQLKQNTVFVLLMEGRADDGQDHNASLIQGLPAGWEIAGRLTAGKTAGMPWLGELTEPEAQPGADDRFAATMSLTADSPAFRLAVRLRAVTPGTYEMPGAELSDMYRPALFARQATARIKVLPAE